MSGRHGVFHVGRDPIRLIVINNIIMAKNVYEKLTKYKNHNTSVPRQEQKT